MTNSSFPHLPAEAWRLRALHLGQMLDLQRDKQQGKALLSSAEMLLLKNSRSQLRSAVQLATRGEVAAARLALVQLLDQNEEVLLHVFGATLPLDYELGLYHQVATGTACLDLANIQADQLLKSYPGHFVGRLSKAVLKLCARAHDEAAALLEPMPRQLGSLGLFKGMQAAVDALTKADADIAKAEIAVLDSKKTASRAIAGLSESTQTEAAWNQLAELCEKLLQGHASATVSLQVPQATCFGLRVAGCLQAGLLSQTQQLCELWLEKAPHHEYHLWAHTHNFFAKLSMAGEPEQLRKVADDATAFLKVAKEHPNVQLESTAFPGQPAGVSDYIRHVEGVVAQARRVAQSLEYIARQEQETASYSSNETALTAFLSNCINDCTSMLKSEDRGLSLAATATMLWNRARFHVRQRELSLALSDLAYSFALWPCSHKVVALWTRILKKLNAVRALRELVRMVEAATSKSPLFDLCPSEKEGLKKWRESLMMRLPRDPHDSDGIEAESHLTPGNYLWLCKNRSPTARGALEKPLREQACKQLADAFGQHAGVTMPQVLLLMVDAIKPQTVLMTGNRQLHRDTPAGPAFHPAALANVEDSLSARPPAHRAAAMPSFGGGSYHPSPGAAAGSSSFAFRPQAQPTGRAHGQAKRPFTRPATPKPAEAPFTGSQPSPPSSSPAGADASFSRPGFSKPSEAPFTPWQAPEAFNDQAQSPCSSAEASRFFPKGPNHTEGTCGQRESGFQAQSPSQDAFETTPVDQPNIPLPEGFAAFFGSNNSSAAGGPIDNASSTAEGSSPPGRASSSPPGPASSSPPAQASAAHTPTHSPPADADLATAFASAFNWNKPPIDTPSARPAASTTAIHSKAADADLAATFASAFSWSQPPADTPSGPIAADGQGNSSNAPSGNQAATSSAPLQGASSMPQAARPGDRCTGPLFHPSSSPTAANSRPLGQAGAMDQEKGKAPKFGAFQVKAEPPSMTGKMGQSTDMPPDGLIASSSYAAAAGPPAGGLQSSTIPYAEAAGSAAADSTAQVGDDLPSLDRPARSTAFPHKPKREAAAPQSRPGASPFSFGRPSVSRDVGSISEAQGSLPPSVDAAAAVINSTRAAGASSGLAAPVVGGVEAFTLGQAGSANGIADLGSFAVQSGTAATPSNGMPPPFIHGSSRREAQFVTPGFADATATLPKPDSATPSNGRPATFSASNLAMEDDREATALGKKKGSGIMPVFNLTANAGQVSAGDQTGSSTASHQATPSHSVRIVVRDFGAGDLTASEEAAAAAVTTPSVGQAAEQGSSSSTFAPEASLSEPVAPSNQPVDCFSGSVAPGAAPMSAGFGFAHPLSAPAASSEPVTQPFTFGQETPPAQRLFSFGQAPSSAQHTEASGSSEQYQSSFGQQPENVAPSFGSFGGFGSQDPAGDSPPFGRSPGSSSVRQIHRKRRG